MSRTTLTCYFGHLLSVVQQFQPSFVRWVLPNSSSQKEEYLYTLYIPGPDCNLWLRWWSLFSVRNLDFCVGSLNGHLQHQTASSAEMVSPQPLSEVSNTEKAFGFSPIDGQLRYGKLWLKEGTAFLRKCYHCSKWLFPHEVGSDLQLTESLASHTWLELGYSPRAETALNCNCLSHTGCSVLIIHKRCTQHLTWNLNGDSKNQQKIFQISSYVIG